MAMGGEAVCRVAVVCAVLAWCAVVSSAPAQICSGASEDDPNAAKFCQALNTFLELYSEAAGERVPEYQGSYPEYQALVRQYPQLLDTGMKRQDVVHSFLRFGRRR